MNKGQNIKRKKEEQEEEKKMLVKALRRQNKYSKYVNQEDEINDSKNTSIQLQSNKESEVTTLKQNYIPKQRVYEICSKNDIGYILRKVFWPLNNTLVKVELVGYSNEGFNSAKVIAEIV